MATAHESYEFVNLGPDASGWRAVFVEEDGGSGTVPLVTWGIFHKTRRQATGEVTEDLGNVMEGVIANGEPGGGPIGDFSCAKASPGLDGYLPPGTQGS